MEVIDITDVNIGNSRKSQRENIINLFLKEEPGKGKGEHTTRYKYIVKRLETGKEIYLRRPAQFNNGFDFTVCVSEFNFNEGVDGKRYSNRPTHGNILDDLQLKKAKSPNFPKLLEQVKNVFECKPYSTESLTKNLGLNNTMLLECTKWLFLEQDVTYWNYSGRYMLMQSIKNI